ncbi:hypothetical protein BGZ97_006149 [Linnemannia gamsii]|uniref:Uncharacterized protein n=1 Tax=Linnemannia gamsii TaxID=64522 RepID=A0A9P6UG01_9FUNG|nr:hypothetical protein BGZ97_006149 [Linnemannia gamsii]
MDDSIFFRTANVTRWNSKFHLIERVYEYRDLLEATAEELQQMQGVSKDERKKFNEFPNQLLSAEELDVLAEVIGLLRPAAEFTHWAGGSDYSTISQVYEKVHRLLPPVTTLQTEGAQTMHMHLANLINSAWPLDDISDGMLLANPGCAGSEIWGRENANQVVENAAEDAAATVAASEAAAETAAQGAGQDVAQDPLHGGVQVPRQVSGQGDPSDPFNDHTSDPPLGVDQLPDQIPYKKGRRPKPTNRLRAETLVYRAIIQRQVDLTIEERKAALASNSFNPLIDANEETMLHFAQVYAESCIVTYRAVLTNTTL